MGPPAPDRALGPEGSRVRTSTGARLPRKCAEFGVGAGSDTEFRPSKRAIAGSHTLCDVGPRRPERSLGDPNARPGATDGPELAASLGRPPAARSAPGGDRGLLRAELALVQRPVEPVPPQQ